MDSNHSTLFESSLKSLKFLHTLTLVDEFNDGGPEGAIQNGWSWYMGI